MAIESRLTAARGTSALLWMIVAGALLTTLLATPSLLAQEAGEGAAAQAAPAPAASEVPVTPIEPRGHSEAFLETIRNEDEAVRTSAAETLMAGSLIAQRDPEAASKIGAQVVALEGLFGVPIGFERLREERFGESLLRLLYVSKYQQAPIMWEFFYYRPDGEWSLINVNIQRGFGLLRNNP